MHLFRFTIEIFRKILLPSRPGASRPRRVLQDMIVPESSCAPWHYRCKQHDSLQRDTCSAVDAAEHS